MVRKIYIASGKMEIWAVWWQNILKKLLPAITWKVEQAPTEPIALGEVMRKSQNVNKCVTVISCTVLWKRAELWQELAGFKQRLRGNRESQIKSIIGLESKTPLNPEQ